MPVPSPEFELPTPNSEMPIYTTPVSYLLPPRSIGIETIEERIPDSTSAGAYYLRLTTVEQAAEPRAFMDPALAPYIQGLLVDVGLISQLLQAHGQTADQANALRVVFVDANKLRAQSNLPAGVKLDAWHEPEGAWRQKPGGASGEKVWFANYIGVPIHGPEDMTEAGLAELNRKTIHEVGHCAVVPRPTGPRLYDRDETTGRFLPYWHKRVFGVVPVALAVGVMRKFGHSEFEALWKLEKQERRARAFERRYADLNIITLEAT